MKVVIGADGMITRITKLMDPALAYGEYIGATLIGAAAAAPLAGGARGHLAPRPLPVLRRWLPGTSRTGRRDRRRPHRRCRVGRGR